MRYCSYGYTGISRREGNLNLYGAADKFDVTKSRCAKLRTPGWNRTAPPKHGGYYGRHTNKNWLLHDIAYDYPDIDYILFDKEQVGGNHEAGDYTQINR